MKYTITSEGDLLFKIDIGLTNYSQRNNKYVYIHPRSKIKMTDALSMCNTTSYCEAGEINGFNFPIGEYNQPEDNLTKFIHTNHEVLDFYKRKMPAMYDAFDRGDKNCYPPNQIHAVLCYGFNKWMGCSDDKPIATFSEGLSIFQIMSEIIEKDSAVVMSGTFPYTYANGSIGTIGHINVLVGLKYSKAIINKLSINIKDQNVVANIGKIVSPTSLIFDDPYGNMYKNFAAGTGNDVEVLYEDFIKCYKPLNDVNKKYAHTFRKAAATI
jgi:hypothetical protein